VTGVQTCALPILAFPPGNHAHDRDRVRLRAGHGRPAVDCRQASGLDHLRPAAGLELRNKNRMSKRWYVVHVYSGMEKSVHKALVERIERAGLQDAFGRILVPSEERSEEHTSELQSRENLVCRLLL